MSERRKRKPKPVKITPKPKLKERPERDDAGFTRWLRGAALTITLEAKR